jgi:hypothetical protein
MGHDFAGVVEAVGASGDVLAFSGPAWRALIGWL